VCRVYGAKGQGETGVLVEARMAEETGVLVEERMAEETGPPGVEPKFLQ